MTGATPPPGGRRARRSLGQNFLVDGNLQRRIVEALGAGPDDEVLEIGPGRGALTLHLEGTSRRLVLVELDDEFARHWSATFEGRPDVTVVHGDVLSVPLAEVVDDRSSLLVIGNIPYNITTPILFHLLERPRPARIVLMVQKEVGERMVAAPGAGDYGALAVGVQSVAEVRRLFGVSRRAFRPVPGVDSVVLEIVPHAPPRLTEEDEHDLRVLTRAAFQWRRKQLQKTLRDHPDLGVGRDRIGELEQTLGLDLRRRPETFAPERLLELARAIR
ncbi:16S rRNA (adenine(1518)-N(6)/adenine(1519)-N(6))-dimethyltransferase RsmA [Gaopeijia maritima]|uniref:Ribosomal RNA small subunit methyltransferase A n=1 Tax=Gaopeijia maritima TaxID=3119007 RepID=A0ABU9EBM1_9BACT